MRTKLSQFNFNLPQKLIAQYPKETRDGSRLMVVNRETGEIEHRVFKDVLEYFDDGDCFIFNNTKVFPARLYGRKEKTGASIEVFLLRELNHETRLWMCWLTLQEKFALETNCISATKTTMIF